MKKLLLLATLTCAVASAQTPLTVILNWSAPTTYSNGTAIPPGTAITYNLYETTYGVSSGGTMLLSGLADANFTVSAGVGGAFVAGQTVCFNVSAVVGGIESAYSNQACKTFAAPPPAVLTPSAPTNLTAQ